MVRSLRPILLLAVVVIGAVPVCAQTTVYHLHTEASSTAGLLQLKTIGPDVATVAIQSADLKNHGAEDAFLKSFDAQSGPGLGGIIPANSTLTFTIWMKKTASQGTVFPRVSAGLNWGSGPTLCDPTNGSTAITTTQASYTVTCTTGASDITMAASDRIWVSVGYHMTAGPGNKSMKVELDIEGTSLGPTDSRVDMPNPVAPTISSLSVASGPVNWPVTITGTYFGASQGTGTVRFNGTSAAVTSWNNTTIQTNVPAGATTGPVTVTTSSGRVSNGVAFTVVPPPTLTSVTPGSGHAGDSVTIAGSNFMATQGTSSVTFNGASGTPTNWGDTSITVPVPAGASTGSVVVTVSSQASNAVPFIVVGAPALTSATPSSARVGATVTITGSNFGASQGTSTVAFNGTAATPSYWSNTAITAPVPAGASSGNVVVTVANQASNGLPFTVAVPGTIGGTVTRVTGGSAISDAAVQAWLAGIVKGSATTAANGTYSIPSLDPGTYEVWISATGFSNEVRQSIVVTSSSTTTVNVAMSGPGSISGTITQADGVTPIAGAAVSAFAGSVEKGSASTNGSGAYAISNLHAGSYTVRAANVGNRTKEQAATVVESSNTTVNLSLDSVAAGSVAYVYDEIGRLVQVTDQAGDSAIYRYDAVGNITAIERGSGTTVTISEFTPDTGPIGTGVTIYGTGFSATANENTVTFNGVAATVTSASTTQIVAAVPSGASTGVIGVTAPAGSATSTSPFTVGSAAPTITGFSPASAIAGTAITITGTNFDPSAAIDHVLFNRSSSAASSASATSLTSAVPASTGSGRISVSTPFGTAVSADDLIIPPSPYGPSDVADARRLPVEIDTTYTVSTANTIALALFDGAAGQRMSVYGFNGMSGQQFGCDVNASLYSPSAVKLTNDSCMESTGFIDVQTLPVTGTYTVLIDPVNNTTGSLTLTLFEVPDDFSSAITLDGSPLLVETTTPGQNAALTFPGTSGQRVSVLGSNASGFNQSFACDLNVTLRKPDGSTLGGTTCMDVGGFIDVTTLPTDGTYTVRLDPPGATHGSITMRVYDVPADLTGPIATDGTPLTFTTTIPGLNGAYTFSGTNGQRISLVGSGASGFNQTFSCDLNVRILKPDTATLVGPVCMDAGGFIEPVTLPSSGTYSISLDPVGPQTGSLTLALYIVPADTTGTVTIGGSAVAVSITTPGQNGSLTFSGTASQQVTVHVTNNPWTVNGPTVKLISTDGTTVLTSKTSFAANFDLSTVTLPATGTYTITVDPSGAQTGSLNVGVTSP